MVLSLALQISSISDVRVAEFVLSTFTSIYVDLKPRMENPNNSYDLPEDILIEILSRLPAKSAGRCRCLSKSWRRNLSTPQFIKTHLNRKTNQKDATILLLGVKPARTISCSNLFDENDKVVPRNIDFPDGLKNYPRIVGSCNGLVSLLDKNKDDIFVINPLTLQHVSFKSTPLLSVGSELAQVYYGFGYDGCSDDYKIVKLTKGYIDGEKAGPFVHVYSMKKGSWKRINNFPFNTSVVISYGHGIFMNGAIHWMAYNYVQDDDVQYVIAAFDVATESFHVIPVPKMDGSGFKLLGISGCLFLISASSGVWIMKEYGQVNSWTNYSTTSASDLHPVCAIGDDEVLLWSFRTKSLIVWKLTEGTTKDVMIDGTLNGCTFVASLVSPIQQDIAT